MKQLDEMGREGNGNARETLISITTVKSTLDVFPEKEKQKILQIQFGFGVHLSCNRRQGRRIPREISFFSDVITENEQSREIKCVIFLLLRKIGSNWI